jgi:hypothetical protein
MSIESFYICQVCNAVYSDAEEVDCMVCDNKRCIYLYQADSFKEALQRKNSQTHVDLQILLPILQKYITDENVVKQIVSDVIDADVPLCGGGFRCDDCTYCSRTKAA